jgi:fermentation-respiration switch protein FrsA (DUF1100 family)/ketosteroid isomerase-like protein
MKQHIQFNSDGLVLAGHLYLPDKLDPEKKYPAIVVGGSWTTVKEQMSGLYADALSKSGFISLAIDPRYFGESEGQPRFWENPKIKIADYTNAITYLQSLGVVDSDKVFLVSVCASSGYLASIAAQDPRVKGLATIAAWLHDEESVKLIYGGEEGVQSRIAEARQAKKNFAENGEIAYIPTISSTDPRAAMYGDFDYYLNPTRGAIPEWSADKFAVMSWEDWLTFNPMPFANKIKVPTLMIHSDGAVLGDNVKRFFQEIPHSNKELHWTEGSQFDFYDQPRQVAEAVQAIALFFDKQIILAQVRALFEGADQRNWTKVKSVLDQHVILDYSSMTGNPANQVSSEQIQAAWAAFLPGFDRTNHQLSGFTLARHGDTATVQYDGKADHYLAEKVWTVEGSYTTRLQRVDGYWLINEHQFSLERQSGDTTLAAMAAKKMEEEVLREQNRKIVDNFFVALETQQFELLKEVFAVDGKQLNPYAPQGFPASFDGADNIYRQYSGLVTNFGEMKFPRQIFATEDPNFFFVQFKGQIEIRSGGKYENDYLGTFRLAQGKVIEYTEYFNQIVMAKAFGITLA